MRPKGSRSPSSPEPGTLKGFVAGAKELGHEVPDGEAFLRAQQGKGFAWGPRRAALAPDQLALARRLLEEGRSASEVAAMFKVHRATLYRALGAAPPATKIAADAARPRR